QLSGFAGGHQHVLAIDGKLILKKEGSEAGGRRQEAGGRRQEEVVSIKNCFTIMHESSLLRVWCIYFQNSSVILW
ncbi:MAG: hypothetical protein F6K41_19265, partial [Symploca sp. SIO3E6]|nr:hypothetical protein [Caldora sp. SIO3E6]